MTSSKALRKRRRYLSDEQVEELRRLALLPGMSQRHLAEAFRIHESTVSRIVRGNRRADVEEEAS